MKKIKKIENTIIVDLTNITLDDVYRVFADAKFNTMRESQRDCIKNVVINEYFDKLHTAIASYVLDDMNIHDCNACKCECCENIQQNVKKKPNVFKRFWNWITRKK